MLFAQHGSTGIFAPVHTAREDHHAGLLRMTCVNQLQCIYVTMSVVIEKPALVLTTFSKRLLVL